MTTTRPHAEMADRVDGGDSAPALGIALLLVDVVNGFDFPESDGLLKRATQAAPKIETVANSARENRVPVIYVNDNFGMWQSDFRAVREKCLHADQPGRHVTRRLLPQESDYFVLKPRHSGFLGTPLEALLAQLETHVVVLAGFATDLCVLFTALDAHARGFQVAVVEDATAANDDEAQHTAITLIDRTLRAPTLRADDVDWQGLARVKRRAAFKSL